LDVLRKDEYARKLDAHLG
jgi:hypothetical protein